MRERTQISAGFFTDLDLVCATGDAGALPATFLKDLEAAYTHARALSVRQPAVSVADLTTLAQAFGAWRGHQQQLLQEYLPRLRADDPLLSPVSLFGTMDYGRLETAHTRTLAWLLDDRGEHGFGSQLLEALLCHLLKGRRIDVNHVDRVESEYPIYCGPGQAQMGRIDILAEGNWEEMGNEASWRLVIEAKIDAEEGDDQLSRYDEWLGQCPQPTEVIRVFLTPEGRNPRTTAAEWQTISFLDLAGIFRRLSDLQDKPGYHFLRLYLTGVLRDICELPVPISLECRNPYAAVQYLRLALGCKAEDTHGDSR